MDQFLDDLDHVLMESYYSILRLEEYTLKKNRKIQLSISEMHLIDCVAKGGEQGITISELAAVLNIKSPSVTVAVNKLEKKGYVRKAPCEHDGRVVRVFLTKDGKRIDAYRKFYHRRMAKRISEDFSEEEKAYLLKAIHKITEFFIESIGEDV